MTVAAQQTGALLAAGIATSPTEPAMNRAPKVTKLWVMRCIGETTQRTSLSPRPAAELGRPAETISSSLRPRVLGRNGRP